MSVSGPTQPPGATTLAERQAALVRALVTGAAVPAGFDADAVGAAADAVLSKRAGEVARRFPLLVHACDGDFTAAFRTWAREHPKTTTPADAAAFAAATGIIGAPNRAEAGGDSASQWRSWLLCERRASDMHRGVAHLTTRLQPHADSNNHLNNRGSVLSPTLGSEPESGRL
ncbi:hypothetical protein [Nocardia gipuzkoensis]|uniref:hypothetical protein n=1 Tax=Nocardia gipuzkoensis TaxID=2749991 RepID=UPI003EE27519